jgi:small-conductance mechanosensitive channel
MESLRVVLEYAKRVLDFSLFTLGNSSFTLRTMLYTLVLLALLFYVTAKLRTWTVERLLAKSKVDLGVRHAIVSFIRYVVLFIGVIVILQTEGINLSTLTVLTGALGIGVGFGLQSITNNFVSGLIILLERPIKVGIVSSWRHHGWCC